MSRRREAGRSTSSLLVIASLAAAATFGMLCGCTIESEPTPEPLEVADVSELVDNTGYATADWLDGAWDVTYTLDEVTAAVFEEDAEIGESTVLIEVSDSEMRVVVDGVTYTGVVVFGEEDFRFEGSTTYEEEDGSVSESDAIMSGTRTGDDSWSGGTWADFRSDGEYVYEAAWTQEAARVP